MSFERADGFWWVRWDEAGKEPQRWQVIEVSGDAAIFGDMYEETANPEIEWGPYLGTAPNDALTPVANALGVPLGYNLVEMCTHRAATLSKAFDGLAKEYKRIEARLLTLTGGS